MEECPCCYDDETVEYVANAQSYRCTHCGAHWLLLAVEDIHYFADGTVHKRKDDVDVVINRGGR